MPAHAFCSTSDEGPAPANRRSGERHLCLFKNVSTSGALIRAYCELHEGQPAGLELKERQPIPGRISWVKGSDAGLQFDADIDVLDLLKVGSEGPRPRMP